ncbi:potassium/proton antiporter, CPA1 family [Lentibacillus persicus]|uniref:Potassium/proton antiporter, CPA1 family n=1 Tax=Lentibacillus persicus TaxID=640948 RepID=A0A1I1UJT3_9BACI|nr:potassium/proton antiporter [Lentibacillus persicus]SFD68220.1 potassium/proton antiporter, CPA1 family [Lentibacillus persicus]
MDASVTSFVLLFALMLLVGVFTTKFSARLGLPSLVLFLFAGMLLNEFIYFENVELTQLIGILALVIILFEGGTQTKWNIMRPILAPAGVLATVGVLITSVITGFAAYYILDLTMLEGMLFGAIVGSTDAAAVFAVLGSKNINKRLTATLEAESGSNDPMAVFLTVAFIEMIQVPETTIWSTVGDFFIQMGFGLVFGLLFGRLSVLLINKIQLDVSGMYPLLALGSAVLTFGVTDYLGGSGFLAVYVMGVLVGNSDLMHKFSIVRFNEGFAWMMQIIMFIFLGMLVFPSDLVRVGWQGIVLALILMFVARPVATFLSMIFFKYNMKEQLFLSWTGLKGAVPIVLATYPIVSGVENGYVIFNAVFFVVLISALVQGSTLSPLASKLGLTEEGMDFDPSGFEMIHLGNTNSEIIKLPIGKKAPVVQSTLIDITLPSDTLVIGIVRNEELITPSGATTIESGDMLFVLSDREKRSRVKEIILGKKEKKEKPKKKWWDIFGRKNN